MTLFRSTQTDILSFIERAESVDSFECIIQNSTPPLETSIFSNIFSYPKPPQQTYDYTLCFEEKVKKLTESYSLQAMISKIEKVLKHMQLLKTNETVPPNPSSLFTKIESILKFSYNELVTNQETDLDEGSFEIIPPTEAQTFEVNTLATTPPIQSSGIVEDAFDAYTTLSSYIYGWVYPPSVSDLLGDTAEIPIAYERTIKKLIEEPGSRLRTKEVIDCMSVICDDNASKLKCEILGLGMTGKESIRGREPSKLVASYLESPFVKEQTLKLKSSPHDLVFIPFVYKGSPLIEMIPGTDPGHIVLITISFIDKTVEYYDSLAYRPEEWTCYENFQMHEELKKIRDQCFPNDPKVKIISKCNKQQHDWHSCGVYILNYMRSRTKGLSFSEINADPMINREIQMIRIDLAKMLFDSK